MSIRLTTYTPIYLFTPSESCVNQISEYIKFVQYRESTTDLDKSRKTLSWVLFINRMTLWFTLLWFLPSSTPSLIQLSWRNTPKSVPLRIPYCKSSYQFTTCTGKPFREDPFYIRWPNNISTNSPIFLHGLSFKSPDTYKQTHTVHKVVTVDE